MTPVQMRMYRAEWAKCWKAIVNADGGRTTNREDDVRAAVTFKAIGRKKSSRDFSNTEFDQVMAVIWSISQADNLSFQLRQIDQPLTRAEGSVYCHLMLEAIEIDPHAREAYLGGICRRIFKKELADLRDDEWPTVLAALNHTRVHKNGIAHNHSRAGKGRERYDHRVGGAATPSHGARPATAPRAAGVTVDSENPF
jgi:hypothetical protein